VSTPEARLRLRIVPNAKRSQIAGHYGDAIKVKVAAPAVEGKATEALLDFLATALGISRRTLSLAAGEKSRDKMILVEGLDLSEVRQRLTGGGPSPPPQV
jgi:uncharacterized protein (TIGR00251 family)